MPYRSVADLPEQVRGILPPLAQEVYQQAFNSAWEACADDGEEREASAHRFAWKSAIKGKYRKGSQAGH